MGSHYCASSSQPFKGENLKTDIARTSNLSQLQKYLDRAKTENNTEAINLATRRIKRIKEERGITL